MVGQTLLGKYKVLRQLDEGGMSKIYLARQLQPEREVVVKVMKEGLLTNPKAREHFRREIHITSRFRHPNAVTCHDAAPNERSGPILVMEYLRGVDLNTLLQREGRLVAARVGRLLAQLCDVLQAAHDSGIVHRDVKPGNIMLLYPGTPQETVKLMDFGLAKMTSLLYISPDELADFSLPPAAGTPEYIPPEEVRGNPVDGRSDLYSLGVVLFEMLTGRRLFQRASAKELMRAHAEEQPPTYTSLGLGDLVPSAVEVVVRSCLAKYPDHRPQSARELAQRYEQALGRAIHTSRRPAALPAVPAPLNLARTPVPELMTDPKAVQHTVQASMPESMAMLKLKGFIHDLGGEVVESVPGMIRVRLEERKAGKKSGIFSLISGRPPVVVSRWTDLELHMERRDPSKPSLLTITLVQRAGDGNTTPEWRSRCSQVGRDLQAYLIGC
jgi:serine/threonine-protein kinase